MQFVPMALIAAAGVGSAVQQRNAGAVQSIELEQEAKQEGDALRAREIDRRRDLLRALASQSAAAGAGGIAFGGSQAAIANRDINDASNDLLYDQGSTANRMRSLRASARNARRMGRTGSIVSLLDTAGKTIAAMP